MLPRSWTAFLIVTFLLSAGFTLSDTSAFACGRQSDCQISQGNYRIFLPDGVKAGAKIPAIIHIHGLGRTSEIVMRNRGFRKAANRLGVALIAANGIARSWTFRNGVVRGKPRDEFSYFREIVRDATERFPIDRRKIVVSGFSIGASMVWNIACQSPDFAAGYIPVAGTLWRPQPRRCAGQIGNIHHYHGSSDPTFPLIGRRVAGKHQGAIADTFEIMFRQDSCTRKVVERPRVRNLRCRIHRNCSDETLQFCLHGGGHDVKAFYLEHGFRAIAQAKGWQPTQ